MANEEKNLRPRSELSPSLIKTYEQCLLKYWYRYHTKEKALPPGIELRFGIAVHSSMEELGHRIAKGEPLTQELCESVAQNFLVYAAKGQITDPALLDEGQQFVRERLYRHNPNYKITGIELRMKKYKVTTNKGVPLNGIVDLSMEMDPSTAIILDYKTSRRALTLPEAKSDIQLSQYDLMYSKLFGQYQKIWLAIDYLRSSVVVTDRHPEERQKFEDWINALWEAMGDLREADVTPNLNGFCPWCEYRHICSEYKSATQGEIQVKPPVAITTEEEFTTEWKKAKALENIAKQRAIELRSWADHKVTVEGQVEFSDKDTVVAWTQGTNTSYDVQTLLQHVPPEDLHKVLKANNQDINRYMKERPDLRPLIETAARKSPGSPRMMTRSK
jgi:CRISPR/Cas system-associated exonuclease Cas4 (RecB family)